MQYEVHTPRGVARSARLRIRRFENSHLLGVGIEQVRHDGRRIRHSLPSMPQNRKLQRTQHTPSPEKYADRTIKGCHIFDARSLEGRDYGHTKIKLVRQTVSQNVTTFL